MTTETNDKCLNKEKLKSAKLAINGGSPVRTKAWSDGPFHFKSELERLAKVLSGPALALARGESVMEFREKIKELYGTDHVITSSSGSSAIHVALAASGVKPGDEVIVSPLTDFGSIIGVLQLNAVPVFCDVIKGGLVIDHNLLKDLITDRTKVIMPVHNGGYCADMNAIMQIAQQHNHIKVIEDCAQAHLTKLDGKYVGLFGDFGCFSTNESKHMKTGEGGFILCKNKDEAEYADLFADKCYPRAHSSVREVAFPALNVRMSEIAAAIGIEQVTKLPDWVNKRNIAGEKIKEIIQQYPLQAHWEPAGLFASYWWFAFYLDSDRCEMSSSEFILALQAEGIPCTLGPQPFIPSWEIFRKLNENPDVFPNYRPDRLKAGSFNLDFWPQAQWTTKHMIAIPVNQHTGDSELSDLKTALSKIMNIKQKAEK